MRRDRFIGRCFLQELLERIEEKSEREREKGDRVEKVDIENPDRYGDRFAVSMRSLGMNGVGGCLD